MVDPNSGAVSTVPKSASSTGLASSLNPSNAGQAVTFTATVTPSAATGSVRFDDGASALGTAPLSGGVATWTTSSLAAGTHSVKATYLGDAAYNSSASAPVSQVVNGVAASLRVTAPNGGEQWKRKVNQSIRWTYAGVSGSVRIQLLRNGAVVSTIASSATLGANGAGSYTWRPSPSLGAGGGYQVRVSVNGVALTDSSDATFSIL
ncbi:MAG: Ig-like domain repeat protein [Acidimicrobiales bacterium]